MNDFWTEYERIREDMMKEPAHEQTWKDLIAMVVRNWSRMRRTFPPIGTALTTYDENVLRDIYCKPMTAQEDAEWRKSLKEAQ